MAKVAKWIGITLGVLIILIIALVFVVPRVVDVNRYKPHIEDMVTERTGRPFSIRGDMDVTLFPWVGFSLSDVHVGNAEGFREKDFVSMEHFEIRVKLIPLIFRDLQVKRFILKGPRIVLEKDEGGRGNWEDLLKSREDKEAKKRLRAEKKRPFTIRNLTAHEFAVTAGELVWIDHRKGTERSLTGMNLVLDGIYPGQPMSLEFSAHLNGQPLEVRGKVGPLGRPLGEGKVPILLNVRALDGLVAKLQGLFSLGRKPQFSVAIEVQPFSPRKLAKAVGLDLSKRTRDPNVLKEMWLKTTIAGTTAAFELRDGLLKLDESALTFSLDAKWFEKPVLSINLDLDSIDLDRYLPLLYEAKEQGEPDTRPQQRGGRKPYYTSLRKLVMDGRVRIGSLKVGGANVSDVSLTINAKNGIIRGAPISMKLFGGALSGNVTVSIQEDMVRIKPPRQPKEVLSRLITVSREMRISSLEFDIHGTSLQVKEVFSNLGRFLPSAVQDWKSRGEMAFDLSVEAKTGHKFGITRLNLEVQLKNGGFSSPDGIKKGDGIEGDTHVSLNVPAQQDQPVAFQGELGLEAGKVLLGSFNLNLKGDPFRLRFLGEYEPKGGRIPYLTVDFHTPTLGKGTITATVEDPADPRGEAKVTVGPISNKRAFDLFVRSPLGRVSPALNDISINGETRITAMIRGSLARYLLQGQVETSAVDLAIPLHQLRAAGLRIRLPFSVEFPEPGGRLSLIGLKMPNNGLVHADRIKWKSHQWRNVVLPVGFVQNSLLLGSTKIPMMRGAVILEGAQIQNPLETTREITLGLRLDRIDLSEVTQAVSPAFVQFVPPGFLEGKFSRIRVSEDELVTRGDMTVHTLGGQIEFSNIQGRFPFSGLPGVSMDMFINDILLEEASLGPFLPAAILNWKLSGTMAFDLGVEAKGVKESKNRTVHLGAQLKSAGFSSPDETKLGEGIRGEIHIKLNFPSQQERPTSFQGDLNLEAGEILLGSFYLNLQQDPFRMWALGLYEAKTRRIPSLRVRFHAPTLGEGTIEATVEDLDHPQGEVNLSLGPLSNKRAFELFVREPFGQVSPALNDISINGETRITASINGSRGRYSIQGALETSVEDLSIPAHAMKAKGVKIQLPVWLRYPQADRAATSAALSHPMQGFIEAERIQWESYEWPDLSLPLILKQNTLFLPSHIKFPIWGGTVVIEGAKIQDPFGKRLEVTLGLRLDGVDLSELTKAFAPFALPGSLESDFPQIRVSAEGLVTRGNLTIHTLGGEVEVSNIQGETPFSRLRELSMDVLLRDIDLGEVSRFFKFGEVGGVIEGWVRGLTFSFGQPEKFELEIRSVKKSGVKQYVNAEAVNDLSILSSGSPFFIRRGILRVVKYFPYAKLGIYCKLENDIFTLRGTIRENGVEYLIRRSPLRGIDIINRDPENRIRWKQMLSRLKAVSQGVGVAEGPIQK